MPRATSILLFLMTCGILALLVLLAIAVMSILANVISLAA